MVYFKILGRLGIVSAPVTSQLAFDLKWNFWPGITPLLMRFSSVSIRAQHTLVETAQASRLRYFSHIRQQSNTYLINLASALGIKTYAQQMQFHI